LIDVEGPDGEIIAVIETPRSINSANEDSLKVTC
jgi:hypothetical protein